MIKPWPHLGTKFLGDYRVFKLRSDIKTSPRTGRTHDFFVLECVNWVNVIAVTPEDQLVMVEQYRHGSNTIELEVPGGVMDASDPSPVAAGVRELREETGYAGRDARLLGEILANPAIMTNTCFTVIVEHCVPTHAVEFDSGEDLITKLVPIEQLPDLVASGKIRHSLVVVALYHFERWRGARKKLKT